jgi:hypothetical protein
MEKLENNLAFTANEWSIIRDALVFQMQSYFENDASPIERLYCQKLGEIADRIPLKVS